MTIYTDLKKQLVLSLTSFLSFLMKTRLLSRAEYRMQENYFKFYIATLISAAARGS